MTIDLSPTEAAELALGVYYLNSGDERQLKIFLANKSLAQGNGQTKL